MKALIASLLMMSASAAMANPFDSFVGSYVTSGAPTIQLSGNVRSCERFGFKYIKGFSVTADTNGYHQSHMLRFYFNGGSIGNGWSGHPVMDYKDQGSGWTTTAITTGDSTSAQNEYSEIWTPYVNGNSSNDLIVSIKSQGSGFVLTVRENSVRDSKTGTCFYQVGLTKQ